MRVLRDTGSARPIAEAIRRGTPNPSEQEIAHNLSRLSEAYPSDLPVELGWQVHDVRRNLRILKRRLARGHHTVPLSLELVEQLDRTLTDFDLNDLPSGDGWKRKIALSENELKRQARIMDDLLIRGNLAAALGLMNEWTVSLVVLRHGWNRSWEGAWL